MARAAKRFSYNRLLAMSSMKGSDVERLSPAQRRVYLERQLRIVGLQIYLLGHELGVDPELEPSAWSWTVESRSKERWSALLQLEYLVAAREAIQETLDAL